MTNRTDHDPAVPDEVDVAAVLADMQTLDVDLTDVDTTDDPPQTTAGNTTPKETP